MGNRPKRRSYGKMRSAVATVARERIDLLPRQAEGILPKSGELSRRYVGLARKISKRTKIRIPKEKKHYFCKKCGLPLVLGKNARVRLRSPNSRIIISCLTCGAVRRYPYRKQG